MCGTPEHLRRSANNVRLGRNSAHWRKLSASVIREARGVCPVHGGPEDPRDPRSKLTADLIGGGDHAHATRDQVRVMCRSCHGRADGGRR